MWKEWHKNWELKLFSQLFLQICLILLKRSFPLERSGKNLSKTLIIQNKPSFTSALLQMLSQILVWEKLKCNLWGIIWTKANNLMRYSIPFSNILSAMFGIYLTLCLLLSLLTVLKRCIFATILYSNRGSYGRWLFP